VKHHRMICTYLFPLLALLVLVASAERQAAGQDKVLAKIGDNVITETDLKEMVSAFPDKSYQTPEGQKKALDYLVNIYVLAAEAEAQGMDKDPEVQRFLKFNKSDLLARAYLEKMTKNLPAPTDQEVKDYYEKNKKEQFTIPESVFLHHVLVKTEKEAKDVLARLKKGEKFSDVASQVSLCPSKAKGGNLDWLPKGSLVKEIEDVAFTMKKDQLSGPVESKFGWHILYLEDKKPPQENSFDQVQGQIVERLKFQGQQQQFDKLSQDLRKKLNVQVTLPQEDPAKPAAPAAGPKN
jgi:peptidyl-prolyl cis-trans isomerase C